MATAAITSDRSSPQKNVIVKRGSITSLPYYSSMQGRSTGYARNNPLKSVDPIRTLQESELKDRNRGAAFGATIQGQGSAGTGVGASPEGRTVADLGQAHQE